MILSHATLIPLIVFVSITLGAWAALGMIAGQPRRAEDRLKRLLDPGASRGAAEASLAKKQDLFQAKVTAAANKLGRSLGPSSDMELGKIRLKLLNAGFRQENAVAVYFGIKVMCLLIALAVAVPLLVMKYGMTQSAGLYVMAAAGLGFYVPDFLLERRKKKRAESIFLGMPDALDLMVVCVEAGLGLDSAMRRVTSELGQSAPVLCEEFAIANFQLQMGRTRRDVLRDLGTRSGVDDVARWPP